MHSLKKVEVLEAYVELLAHPRHNSWVIPGKSAREVELVKPLRGAFAHDAIEKDLQPASHPTSRDVFDPKMEAPGPANPSATHESVTSREELLFVCPAHWRFHAGSQGKGSCCHMLAPGGACVASPSR